MVAIDFSSARPSIGDLHAANVVAVGRYVGPEQWGKTITQAEAQEYIDAGILVWLVFEEVANDALGGYTAGRTNAALALVSLPSNLPGVPIYFAVDASVDPESAVPYFQGIASILSPTRVGVYGEGALCQLLHDDGLATWFWQSESKSFPGNQVVLAITHICQTTDPSPIPQTDLDIIYQADIGAFPRPKTPPTPPKPAPPKPTPEDEMHAVVVTELVNGAEVQVVKVYAAGAGDRSDHLLEFTRVPGTQTNSVIDLTDQIGGTDPYLVQP